MPQWDLLNTLADTAKQYPNFRLLMGTTAFDTIRKHGVFAGVSASGPNGDIDILAPVTVSADGRDSTLRDTVGLDLQDTGVPVDVLWFRIDRPERTPPDTIAYIGDDTVITIPRTDYYQCALFIPKGTFDDVQEEGLRAFRTRVGRAVPFLRPTINSISSFDDVKLLSVRIAHAPRWHRPGFLLIGDAAHPMSPAFGVGINYAIEDAVATARILLDAGAIKDVDEAVLARVQRRRAPAVRAMQQVQRVVHATTGRTRSARRLPPVPVLRAVTPISSLLTRRLTGRLVGAGLRPEWLPTAVTNAAPTARAGRCGRS